MFWSLTIGEIAGTKIRLHFTFLLFVLWAAWVDYGTGGLAAASNNFSILLALFGCILAHEFGHILTARKFGIRTLEVILSLIGGIANMERIPDIPRQELLIAAAGPAVNLAIAALLAELGVKVTIDLASLNLLDAQLPQRLLLANLAMFTFNVIPAFPLDGGRMFRAALALWLNYQWATTIAVRTGQVISAALAILGLAAGPLLSIVGLFLIWTGTAELEIVRRHLLRVELLADEKH